MHWRKQANSFFYSVKLFENFSSTATVLAVDFENVINLHIDKLGKTSVLIKTLSIQYNLQERGVDDVL